MNCGGLRPWYLYIWTMLRCRLYPQLSGGQWVLLLLTLKCCRLYSQWSVAVLILDIYIYMNWGSLKPRYLYIWTMSCCRLYSQWTVAVYTLEYPLCDISIDACHLVNTSITLVCEPTVFITPIEYIIIGDAVPHR